MLGRVSARNKTRKCRKRNPFAKSSCRPVYLKAGIGTASFSDDSSVVNVHAWMPPTVWVEMGMLFLNLAVWLEAAARLAGWTHAV